MVEQNNSCKMRLGFEKKYIHKWDRWPRNFGKLCHRIIRSMHCGFILMKRALVPRSLSLCFVTTKQIRLASDYVRANGNRTSISQVFNGNTFITCWSWRKKKDMAPVLKHSAGLVSIDRQLQELAIRSYFNQWILFDGRSSHDDVVFPKQSQLMNDLTETS